MSHKIHTSEELRAEFNTAVIAELESRERDDVVEMTRDLDSDSMSLSSADVADHVGVSARARDSDAVAEVADARVEFFDEFVAEGEF